MPKKTKKSTHGVFNYGIDKVTIMYQDGGHKNKRWK